MFESFLPLRFPEASQATLLFIGASLFSLFLLAVLMEMLRRRNNRRRLIAAEWDTFERLVQERDFSNQERELLTRIVRNRAADAPLQVVTGRREFDACIEAEMDAQIGRAHV